MPNKPTKSSKASGKLKLTKQTIKDLKPKGDKAGKLRGGIGPATATTLACQGGGGAQTLLCVAPIQTEACYGIRPLGGGYTI
jgi:hypothetical protein